MGIIGNGGEGESLVRSAGFAHPEWVENERQAAERNPRNRGFATFMQQDDLNIDLTAVCDVFDVRAQRGLDAAANKIGPTAEKSTVGATRYLRYTDLLESPDVDAVLIATPDHWHAQMCIDAAAAGKHVYVEKAMTREEEETHRMYDAVKNSDIVFQLGHQQRQTESHIKAREVIQAGILGPITLVETTTNRNDPWGAWVWDIHEEGNENTIDWEQFQGPAPNKYPSAWSASSAGGAGTTTAPGCRGISSPMSTTPSTRSWTWEFPRRPCLRGGSTSSRTGGTFPTPGRPCWSIRTGI